MKTASCVLFSGTLLHLQAITVDFAADKSGTLLLNYPEFPDSCGFIQLRIIKNLFDMVADRTHVNIIKRRHHLLCQPDILALIAHFHVFLLIAAAAA